MNGTVYLIPDETAADAPPTKYKVTPGAFGVEVEWLSDAERPRVTISTDWFHQRFQIIVWDRHYEEPVVKIRFDNEGNLTEVLTGERAL